jgi:hypothetical protein
VSKHVTPKQIAAALLLQHTQPPMPVDRRRLDERVRPSTDGQRLYDLIEQVTQPVPAPTPAPPPDDAKPLGRVVPSPEMAEALVAAGWRPPEEPKP